jgi:dTDP-glucose 4,6-dehydratase
MTRFQSRSATRSGRQAVENPRKFSHTVVTGGLGFVGSHLCTRLLAAGIEVTCLDNSLTGSVANIAHLMNVAGFHLLEQDVADHLHVSGPVDLVLHFASPASPADYMKYPLETMRAGSAGTWNMLDFAQRKRARFVFASTSEVYGEPLEHPQRESYWGNVNPIGPRSVYDESKRFSEALVTAYRRHRGVDTALVRLFNTYGPRMRAGDGRAVPTFIRQALADDDITVSGDGSQTRTMCYIDDTISGILAVAAGSREGPFNIGGAEEISIHDLALLVRELCGSAAPLRLVDRPVDDPSRRLPDTSRIRDQLGWRPQVPLAEGMRRTVAWFVERLDQGAPARERVMRRLGRSVS